jgi:cation efflux system membrane fusion protein
MRKPQNPLLETVLIATLLLFMPEIAISHVGHGDEFQSKGGIEKVQVNEQSDQILGITVKPIAPAPDGSAAVMIPVTALVDSNGKQLVFVRYQNFYEPVEITTGATQGELIEVTKGLSVGEKLVTEGSLSLYAESRKTKNAKNPTKPESVVATKTEEAVVQASEASGIPIGALAIGGGAVLLVGTIAFIASSRGNKRGY